MFTEKEMSDALKWLFDLFQPEDYEAYDEEEVGCAALCLPEVCMALRDKNQYRPWVRVPWQGTVHAESLSDLFGYGNRHLRRPILPIIGSCGCWKI